MVSKITLWANTVWKTKPFRQSWGA